MGEAPLVIDAGVVGGVARHLAADERAAMAAEIDERLDLAGAVAVEHDRHLADVAGAEVAGARDLGFAADQAPRGAPEGALLLELVDRRVVIEAIGDAAVVEFRPNRGCDHVDLRLSSGRTGGATN